MAFVGKFSLLFFSLIFIAICLDLESGKGDFHTVLDKHDSKSTSSAKKKKSKTLFHVYPNWSILWLFIYFYTLEFCKCYPRGVRAMKMKIQDRFRATTCSILRRIHQTKINWNKTKFDTCISINLWLRKFAEIQHRQSFLSGHNFNKVSFSYIPFH